MNLEESLQKLYSLHQFGVKLGLEKPKQLFNYIGNPQEKLQCFHIAGSNAKGSVASFINSILIEEGYKVGLYTSPHFVKFNERIRINGDMIPDDYIMEFMNGLNTYIEENEPTFFELTTAIAFKYFADNHVDYSVIETGLGGRLDATNVIDPVASVLTTISLEHTNILGNSIEKIAAEKAEIIKNKSKAIIGFLPESAIAIMKRKAKAVAAELIEIKDVSVVGKDFIRLNLAHEQFNIYSTPLLGTYQLKNAGLAALTILSSIKLQKQYSVFDGISRVIQNSGIQGRYEIYNVTPKVIFDSSHNSEGIENFISEFRKEKDQYEKCEIVFGAMKDKDIQSMLKKFDNLFDKVMATSFDYERAAKIDDIKQIADKLSIKVEGLTSPEEYIEKFIEREENNCLVILGSIYLLGDIKTKLMVEKT
ncbi:MAG: folylpolyglutamate synthase/dihydrofolate synthase family protein [Melioribacteraceae bacterium]|nr:folylpolyglutamate synthase/dihydrofolate synthase family protein [Melioribacteraceae bacterium]